ncbi:hypothetical protein MKW98_015930 [Papaver atlanticum]|uniref:Uncharacterized protein n=1 Tax=Papaver atlanticum TaxID=357466 RepID=A0AAD4XBT9_9MAGN|nr:hypothetical protein MKW98_015930 [Papaver atlanticum]
MSRLSKVQLHHILFDPSLGPRYYDLICAPHQLSPMIEVIRSVQRNWALKVGDFGLSQTCNLYHNKDSKCNATVDGVYC